MTTPPHHENAPGQLQLTEGESENHLAAGLATKPRTPGLIQAAISADHWWWSPAWRALTWMAEAGVEFDSYALTELGVPDPDHPGRWGALFKAGAAAGLIEVVGYANSKRPSRSGGLVRVWRGRRPG